MTDSQKQKLLSAFAKATFWLFVMLLASLVSTVASGFGTWETHLSVVLATCFIFAGLASLILLEWTFHLFSLLYDDWVTKDDWSASSMPRGSAGGDPPDDIAGCPVKPKRPPPSLAAHATAEDDNE